MKTTYANSFLLELELMARAGASDSWPDVGYHLLATWAPTHKTQQRNYKLMGLVAVGLKH